MQVKAKILIKILEVKVKKEVQRDWIMRKELRMWIELGAPKQQMWNELSVKVGWLDDYN